MQWGVFSIVHVCVGHSLDDTKIWERTGSEQGKGMLCGAIVLSWSEVFYGKERRDDGSRSSDKK